MKTRIIILRRKKSASELADMEPDILNIIDEMEMPDKFLNAFNVVISDLNDTPLYDAATNVKTETLQLLIVFSTWYDVQLDKINDISLGAFQEGKFQFSAKDFNKFYTDINQYLQSIEYRSNTSKLAEKYKSVEKASVFQILTNLSF